MPIDLFTHPINLGLGATIRDGLYRAVQDSGDKDIIITMDADATHNPGLILRLYRMIVEGHDVVIASRFQPGARVIGLVWYRRLISFLATGLFGRILLFCQQHSAFQRVFHIVNAFQALCVMIAPIK